MGILFVCLLLKVSQTLFLQPAIARVDTESEQKRKEKMIIKKLYIMKSIAKIVLTHSALAIRIHNGKCVNIKWPADNRRIKIPASPGASDTLAARKIT
jgi:hypothetical protein